jgi:hypothetical protein
MSKPLIDQTVQPCPKVSELTGYILADSKELDDLIENYDFSPEDEKIVRKDDGYLRISPVCAEVFNRYDCWSHIYCVARSIDHYYGNE